MLKDKKSIRMYHECEGGIENRSEDYHLSELSIPPSHKIMDFFLAHFKLPHV